MSDTCAINWSRKPGLSFSEIVFECTVPTSPDFPPFPSPKSCLSVLSRLPLCPDFPCPDFPDFPSGMWRIFEEGLVEEVVRGRNTVGKNDV